eukprot:GGOE01036812.1.p1 GENE.GGOE01036812.1~~GGOE01036812.1.p1  ORF type:complete len:544 (-),score=165.72 GGOE01036812.1:233-1816(-)
MTDALDDADDPVLVTGSFDIRRSSFTSAASSSPSSPSTPVAIAVDGWPDSCDTSADDPPCEPQPPASFLDGWHTVGHSDLLASMDSSSVVPVGCGPAQHEDVTAVFWARLQRLNVGYGDIHSVARKLQVIRLWLETNDCDDRQPHDEAVPPMSQDDSLSEDPSRLGLDLGNSTDWCYVDLPESTSHPTSTFWLVHRDALQAPLPQSVKLDFGDLAVVEGLLEVVTTKWRTVLTQCINRQAPSPEVVLAMQDILFTIDCFNQHVRPFLFKWYQTGDVIFYDLEARRRLGVERPNLALHLQKMYDTFSHSAIFLWDDGLPKVLHNLNSRLKVCSWRDCVYMAKREIDFNRIFAGFRFLPQQVQKEVKERYREAVVEKAKQSKDYVVENLSFFRGLQYMVTPRQFVPNPPLIRRASPNLEADAGRTHSQGVASDGPPCAVACAPYEYSEMMCAGFTAGFVFECLRDVQGRFSEWQQELAFTPALFIDLDRMTPKDLHQWDVWCDTGQRCPLNDILHPEVLANRDKQPHMQ